MVLVGCCLGALGACGALVGWLLVEQLLLMGLVLCWASNATSTAAVLRQMLRM